jgi:hypothetical protein
VLSLFVLITLAWLIVSYKVRYFIWLSALGFSIETPELFIRKSHYYLFFMRGLTIAAIATSVFQDHYRLVLLWPLLLILSLIVRFLSQKSAFRKYRSILNEMIEEAKSDPNSTEADRAEWLKQSQASDRQLIFEARVSKNYGHTL